MVVAADRAADRHHQHPHCSIILLSHYELGESLIQDE